MSRYYAGLLFTIGVIEFFIGLLWAEATYPGYSIANNTISSLGSMICQGDQCHFNEPAASIFNSSVTILGILIVIGAYLLWNMQRGLAITLIITGIGAIGVGLTLAFHSAPILHTLVSFITFLFAGISALLSTTIFKNWLRFVSPLMGLVSLISMVLFATGNYLGLGIGGMERMIVYPVLLWGLAFGGYLSREKEA
ncbi:MAG TPA: DUF998 domain-containing protein [Geobacterales bacterium]|nr:DUF998 domain-containing protein [Geobacterales bacterium]